MYRRGAPWESGPRPALIELCESGRLTPVKLPPGRAIDLGCGSGADSIYLAQQGFSVTGVDFSQVAIDKARAAAESAPLTQAPVFHVADLLQLPSSEVGGEFDLLFDGGSLDDFPPTVRPDVAAVVTALARPGAVFVMSCFYAEVADLPRLSFLGPSRWGALPIEPDEETALFGRDWHIERFHPRGENYHARLASS